MKTLLFLAAIAALAAVPSVRATTYLVTSTADTGAGTLRAALTTATNGDLVSITTSGTLTLTSGPIAITAQNVTIAGPGANNLTITTAGASRALQITDAQCSISGITFDNCQAFPGDIDTGGAIQVDNFTAGGGTYLTTITDCAFTNCHSGWGGAVDIFQGGLDMERCTLAGNACTGTAFSNAGGGGALAIGPSISSTIRNCTFSANLQSGANTLQPGGGAIYNYGVDASTPPPLVIEHCTFVSNADASGAGGALNANATASYQTASILRNNLLANNQGPAGTLRNFSATASGTLATALSSLGGNVTDESATTSLISIAGDKTAASTLLSSLSTALASNAGSTQTFALLRGSPAQRAGVPGSVSTDQRGAPRNPTAPDAGAFELVEPILAMSYSGGTLPDRGTLSFGTPTVGLPVSYTVTLSNAQTSPYAGGPLILSGLTLPSGFSSPGLPSLSLASGQSASFTITSTDASPGAFATQATFLGNDSFNPSIASGDTAFDNLHAINLSALILDSLSHWEQSVWGAAASNISIAGTASAPSGDGIPNLLKYALGLNPLQQDTQVPMGISTYTDGQYLTTSFYRASFRTDVTIAVQAAADLTSGWTTIASSVSGAPMSGPGLLSDTPASGGSLYDHIVQVRDTSSITSAPHRFLRVLVTH